MVTLFDITPIRSQAREALGAGPQQLDASEFDLEDLLVAVGAQLSESTRSKGLELVIDLPQELPRRVAGDPMRLRLILLNLGDKAIRLTEQGHVCLRLHPRDWHGDELLLHGEVHGSGGTTFWFAVRLRACPQAGGSGVSGSPTLSGRRVLVVDDRPLTRDVLQQNLQQMGCEVIACDNALQALAETVAADADGMPFEVVVVDQQMPYMNGIELAEIISSQGLGHRPVMLLLDGIDRGAGIWPEARRAGVQAVLTKPVLPKALFAALVAPPGVGQPVVTAPSRVADSAVLDTGRGLQLVAGKPHFYRSLLGRFIEGKAEAPGAIRAALVSGDVLLARRLAHTLKSSAAQIGAARLTEAARHLEHAIADDGSQAQLQTLIDEVGVALAQLLEHIDAFLTSEAVSTS